MAINNVPKNAIQKEALKKILTPLQYACTQEGQTEKPFDNAYWNLKEEGLYVDIVNKEVLFSSLHKFDSGSGWPSFYQPIEKNQVFEKEDLSLGLSRIEIRSKTSHLGHVFDDGPKNTTGKRYCVNSSSLQFIPLKDLKKKGYGKYLFDFQKKKGWSIAIVAGGCFWGLEHLIGSISGVIETQVGYIGGENEHPTYETVKSGHSGHAESVRVLYDPHVLTYEKLLAQFFRFHDPTTLNQQGNDKGSQYRSAIFYTSESQKKIAEAMKQRVVSSGFWKSPLVTEIRPAGTFWEAEEEHQKYLEKHPNGYTCHYPRDVRF